MFYGETISETRTLFFESWQLYVEKKLLTPLQQQITQVILEHPEYHHVFEQRSKYQQHTYYPEFGEGNPFLHMGLHLAIREQLSTNRPQGIVGAYQKLLAKYKIPLDVEHLIMEQLAECLWLAQKNNHAPNEEDYLNKLSEL